MTTHAVPAIIEVSPEVAPYVRQDVALSLMEDWGLIPTPELLAVVLPTPAELYISGGWQASKSTGTAFIPALDIMLSVYDFIKMAKPRARRYGFSLPSYKTKPKEMDYLLKWFTQSGMVTSSGPHVAGTKEFSSGASVQINLLGGRYIIETFTGQDVEGIASEAYDIMSVCEAAQQPETIREQVRGRIMTNNGRSVFSGTLERPEWVWFEDAVSKYLDAPDSGHLAVSMPSWANPVYLAGETCQLFEEGCENHGHGRFHPTIAALEPDLGPYAFSRKIAGIPKGVQNPVYGMLMDSNGFYDIHGVPKGRDDWIRSFGAGGYDAGEGVEGKSPTVVCAVTVNSRDEAWVREVRVNYSADRDWVKSNQRQLEAAYWFPHHRWGGDPMQKELMREAGAINPETKKPWTADGSTIRRDVAGLVYARLEARKLYFDMSGPGVAAAFHQMQRVQWRKMPSGHIEYDRRDDDMAAAVEDAIKVIDSKGKLAWAALARPETAKQLARKPAAVSFGGPR